jgi:hypothetical protein
VCSRPLVMASKTGKPACANRQISRRVAFWENVAECLARVTR